MSPVHENQTPSDWVRRWSHLIPDRAGGARVRDLACGFGRHSRWLKCCAQIYHQTYDQIYHWIHYYYYYFEG